MAERVPDEKQWKRIQEILAAEASGKQPRPFVSQRTLFGIKSSVEEQIERIVEEDEAARRAARRGEGTDIPAPLAPNGSEKS